MLPLVFVLSLVLVGATAGPQAPSPPPPPPLNFIFGAAFGSNMVLQQQPSKAAVYGFLGQNGTAVTVSVINEK